MFGKLPEKPEFLFAFGAENPMLGASEVDRGCWQRATRRVPEGVEMSVRACDV